MPPLSEHDDRTYNFSDVHDAPHVQPPAQESQAIETPTSSHAPVPDTVPTRSPWERNEHRIDTVAAYFASAPDIQFRRADDVVERIQHGDLSQSVIVEEYRRLVDEYARVAAVFEEMFPGDTVMRPISLDAVRAASPFKLVQIEEQWMQALRKVDEPGGNVSTVTRLGDRAMLLVEGIREYAAAAEQLNITLDADDGEVSLAAK